MAPQGKGVAEEDMDGMVRIDLKKHNLSKDLTHNKLEWRNIIHLADPNIGLTRL